MKRISNNHIDKVVVYTAILLMSLLFLVLSLQTIRVKDTTTKLPYINTTYYKYIRPAGVVLYFKSEHLCPDYSVTYTIIHKESLGYYFITAYCPHECGYREYDDGTDNFPAGWRTASGEICHRADWEDRLYEPTTCAISRSYHSFGDLFYIEEFDRVFVAEDTGPGVQGKHLDLFYETYEEMSAFPTGYYEVYSVWYEEVDYMPNGENILACISEFVI